jgi:hypothetical protein
MTGVEIVETEVRVAVTIFGVGLTIIVGVLLLMSIDLLGKVAAWRTERQAQRDADRNKLFEYMRRPRHEHLARFLARYHGYSENEWKKFTPEAVRLILQDTPDYFVRRP